MDLHGVRAGLVHVGGVEVTKIPPRCDACGHLGRRLVQEVRDGITLQLCQDFKLCCHTFRTTVTGG